MKPVPFPDVRYTVAGGHLVQAGKSLEYETFAQTGYPGKCGYIEEYEPYPSVFYIAIHDSGDVVGVVRKILPSKLGFTAMHFPLSPTWEERAHQIAAERRCEEVATTALRKGFRGRNNFSCVLHLFRAAYEDAIRSGVEYWFAPIEPLVLVHYRNTFHLDFQEIGEAQDYLGAATIPCVIEFKSGFERMFEQDPELAGFFAENVGPP